MKLTQKPILLLCAVLMLTSMACGLTNGIGNLVGGGNSNAVADLWPDVPKMDGLDKANLDLPLPARLAIQGLVKSSSKGDGNLDFISFTTSKTTTDIADFYSLDKMSAAGWSMQDQTGCQGLASGGSESGGVCFFGKENKADNSGSFLVIFVAQDSKTKQTQVFFLRLDAKNLTTPTP